MEPAHTIILKLGGATAVAECLGIHRTRVSSWRLSKDKGGTDGRIPHWHIAKLMARASEMGVPLSAGDFIVVPSSALPSSLPAMASAQHIAD